MKERPRFIIRISSSMCSFHFSRMLSNACSKKSFILVYNLENPFSLKLSSVLRELFLGKGSDFRIDNIVFQKVCFNIIHINEFLHWYITFLMESRKSAMVLKPLFSQSLLIGILNLGSAIKEYYLLTPALKLYGFPITKRYFL